MSRRFFDSNILVYAVDRSDQRREPAHRLMETGGVVSVQCLNEFASVARRKLRMDWAAVEEARDEVLALCPEVVPITLDVHRHGVELSRERQLSIYDGMIVAAALTAGCDILYSEDMHDGLMVNGKLKVVNPFA